MEKQKLFMELISLKRMQSEKERGGARLDSLRIAENIVEFRKKKGVTQEEMASFLGVTKASVSKWENGQSMPDILMLPQLATYFDVTVDDLLGYEPQLSKEQIQKIYAELGKEFSEKDFEEAFAKSEALVKKYYSCYPFLLQICVLWMNHFMLAKEQTRQQEILGNVEELGNHIQENCKETGLCNDIVMIKAMADLFRGNPAAVIENLEELNSPYRMMSQSDGTLIQAYRMAGEAEKADNFSQISMYQHLLQLISSAEQFMILHIQEEDKCEETIKRIDKLMELYQVEQLHENVAAGYHYQVALVRSIQKREEEAVNRLESFVRLVKRMLDETQGLHGDDYFTGLDLWFEGLDLGPQLIRDKKIILQSARENLDNPVFDGIRARKEFQKLYDVLV